MLTRDERAKLRTVAELSSSGWGKEIIRTLDALDEMERKAAKWKRWALHFLSLSDTGESAVHDEDPELDEVPT